MSLSRGDKILCAIYAATAAAALPATWINNLAFMQLPEGGSPLGWYRALYANPAAASFTNDLLLLAVAACVFMAVEGRRLRVRAWWAYILLSGLTAISVTFPLFLVARQIAIARRRAAGEAGL